VRKLETQTVDLDLHDKDRIQQVTHLLFRGFREHNPNGWPDLPSARREVKASLRKGHISLVAIDKAGKVVGWISGNNRTYQGFVWELHPLVVDPDYHRRGIGTALERAFEQRVIENGGRTIWLGADDEDNMTSISGIDLYPDVLGHLSQIKNIKGHPFEFYQKLGFVIIGALPDADGPGKPDIFMAKQLFLKT